jgi:hypothetical protein
MKRTVKTKNLRLEGEERNWKLELKKICMITI